MPPIKRLQSFVLAVVLVTLAVVVLQACQPPSTPTPPTSVSQVVIVGPNNSGNNSGGTGADAACAGITGTASLTVFSGTFSGGKGKVSEPILARVDGLSIPSSCAPVVEVTASGSCAKPTSIVQTVGQIIVLPNAVGLCSVSACVGQRCAATALDVLA